MMHNQSQGALRRGMLLGGALLALLSLSACEGAKSDAAETAASPQASPAEATAASPAALPPLAPAWNLKRPDGSALSLESLRGQVVVMDFWATWCGPCRLTMPGIEKLHQAFGKGAKGVQFIGINAWERDPSNKLAAAYMKENNYSYGLVLNGDEVAAAYGVEGIPTLVVVDKQGRVRDYQVGYDPEMESKLSGLISSLLAE